MRALTSSSTRPQAAWPRVRPTLRAWAATSLAPFGRGPSPKRSCRCGPSRSPSLRRRWSTSLYTNTTSPTPCTSSSRLTRLPPLSLSSDAPRRPASLRRTRSSLPNQCSSASWANVPACSHVTYLALATSPAITPAAPDWSWRNSSPDSSASNLAGCPCPLRRRLSSLASPLASWSPVGATRRAATLLRLAGTHIVTAPAPPLVAPSVPEPLPSRPHSAASRVVLAALAAAARRVLSTPPRRVAPPFGSPPPACRPCHPHRLWPRPKTRRHLPATALYWLVRRDHRGHRHPRTRGRSSPQPRGRRGVAAACY